MYIPEINDSRLLSDLRGRFRCRVATVRVRCLCARPLFETYRRAFRRLLFISAPTLGPPSIQKSHCSKTLNSVHNYARTRRQRVAHQPSRFFRDVSITINCFRKTRPKRAGPSIVVYEVDVVSRRERRKTRTRTCRPIMDVDRYCARGVAIRNRQWVCRKAGKRMFGGRKRTGKGLRVGFPRAE